MEGSTLNFEGTMGDETEIIDRRADEKITATIKRIAVALGIAATAMTLLGAWVTFPHRLNAVEKSQERLTGERSSDHESLIRIETMLTEIHRRLERMERNP